MHNVQIFSILLLLATLTFREPDAFKQDEVAGSVAAWFGRLAGVGTVGEGKPDPKQTMMLFFSCFAFGPLVLVAPKSQQVFGDVFQSVVDQVEHIVNQQNSGSFDKAMILVLSLLKTTNRHLFIERTGDFVSRKRVTFSHQTAERIQTCKKFIQDFFTTEDADEVINIAASRCSLTEKASLIDQTEINIDSDKLSFRWYSEGGNKNVKNMLIFGLKILRDYLRDGKFDHASQFDSE